MEEIYSYPAVKSVGIFDFKGDTQDKSFYNNYLKSSYISDDAGHILLKALLIGH